MYKALLRDAKKVYRADVHIRAAAVPMKDSMKKTFALMFIAEVMLVLQVYPVKLFVDGVLQGAPTKRLLYIAGGVGLFMLAGSIVNNIMDCFRNDFNMDKQVLVWGEAHAVSLRQAADFHVKNGTGEKESLIVKNAAKVEKLIDAIIFDALPIIARIVLTSIAIEILGWRYGVLALVTLVIYVVILIVNEPHIEPMNKRYHRANRYLERRGSELLHCTSYIRSIGREEEYAERNRRDLRRSCSVEKKRHRKYRYFVIRLEYLVALSTALLYVVVAYFDVRSRAVAAAEIAGAVALSLQWMQRIYSNFYRLTEFQRHVRQGITALRELLDIFLLKPAVTQPETPLWPIELTGRIEVNNLWFRYPDLDANGTCALCDLNLVFEPNSIVGIMGGSGSGKSSLVKLLEMQYRPTRGEIRFDGISLTDIDIYKYRRRGIAVVHQQPVFFDGSIRQNIRVSNPDAPPGAEEQAARLAYIHDFIMSLPDGYDTNIGEGGVKLSGGQRQRLAIARALFMGPAVLILDEATSSLDLESEAYVQEAIDKLVESSTGNFSIIIIAHRLKTIAKAHKVVVMEHGKVVECGTHAELQHTGQRYRAYQALNRAANA